MTGLRPARADLLRPATAKTRPPRSRASLAPRPLARGRCPPPLQAHRRAEATAAWATAMRRGAVEVGDGADGRLVGRVAPRPALAVRSPSRTSTDACARCGVGSLEREHGRPRAHPRRVRAMALRACEACSPAPRAPREQPRQRRCQRRSRETRGARRVRAPLPPCHGREVVILRKADPEQVGEESASCLAFRRLPRAPMPRPARRPRALGCFAFAIGEDAARARGALVSEFKLGRARSPSAAFVSRRAGKRPVRSSRHRVSARASRHGGGRAEPAQPRSGAERPSSSTEPPEHRDRRGRPRRTRRPQRTQRCRSAAGVFARLLQHLVGCPRVAEASRRLRLRQAHSATQ